MKKEYEETTPIYNELLEDKLLTSEEKLTYILLMKYQRFEAKERTFLGWLNSKGLRSETYSKYVKSLQEKNYIKIDSVGNYLFYAINEEGEVINYNNQNFKKFYSENYYTLVKDEILFSNLKSAFQKLALVLLERELKRSQELKNYKIHFSTIGNALSVEEVSRKLKPLISKHIINYKISYSSNSFKSSFIKDLNINYENLKGENKTTDNELIQMILNEDKEQEKKVPDVKEEALPIKEEASVPKAEGIEEELKAFEGNKKHVPMKEELLNAIIETKKNCFFNMDLYSLYGRTVNAEKDKNKRIALSEMWKAYNNNVKYEETQNYIKAYKPYLIDVPEINFEVLFNEACKDLEENHLNVL